MLEQIKQLLEGSVDAAVVLDRDRRVLYYNRAYEASTGLRGRQLAQKVAAIFESMGQSLPDFGGHRKEVLALAVEKMELAHEQMRREHAERVDLLERRLAKVSQSLELTEGELRRALLAKGVDPGVASIYRTVQGLSDVEHDLELKREMMAAIFEANLELRTQLSERTGRGSH